MKSATATTVTIRPQIDAANRQFVERFNAGDVEGAARGIYTVGARILPPGAGPVTGRENIIQFWGAAALALGITQVKLTTVELELRGDTAYEIGRADLRVAGGTQGATGKYVVIWKQEGGEWRWDVDIWNMDS